MACILSEPFSDVASELNDLGRNLILLKIIKGPKYFYLYRLLLIFTFIKLKLKKSLKIFIH